jgi:exosortase
LWVRRFNPRGRSLRSQTGTIWLRGGSGKRGAGCALVAAGVFRNEGTNRGEGEALIVETASAMSSQKPTWPHLELVAFGLVVLALGWAYAPTFVYLSSIWGTDPNYSYGYLVVPATLWILWLRRGLLDPARVVPWRWGWLLLAGVFVLRSILFARNDRWLEDATVPLAVASLALAFGGWHLFRWSLPGIIFLCFMLPLPVRINMMLANPLQQLATVGSCNLLDMLGLPAVAEGNVINIGGNKLEVARACNGLSMLLSFITLLTAVAILVERPLVDRILLLASAIPIALVVNILRISITGLCFYFKGTDELLLPFGRRMPHDWAGYLMPPMGLLMVWLELKVMSWLFIAEEEEEPESSFTAFGRMAPAHRPAQAGGAPPGGPAEPSDGA